MKKYYISIFLLLLSIGFLEAQQLPLHTQFLYNKLAYNPAYAGSNNSWQITGMYRNQWIGLEGAPKTINFSAHGNALGEKSSLGIQLRNFELGISNFTNVEGVYSYTIPLSDDTRFSIGLSASMRHIQTDYRDARINVTTPVEIDPSLILDQRNQWDPNFGIGLYLESDDFFIGLSSPRIVQQDLAFEREMLLDTEEAVHFYLMGGYAIELKEHLTLLAQSKLRYTSNAPFDADISGILRINNSIDFGLNYRLGGINNSFGESIDLLASILIDTKMRFGFSYDLALSDIREVSDGSVELLIQYNLLGEGQEQILVNPRIF